MAALPKRLAVIGAGQMGAGIAQVVATSGIATKLVDQSEAVLDRAVEGMEKSLAKLVAKGRLDAGTAEGAMERLYTTTKLQVRAGGGAGSRAWRGMGGMGLWLGRGMQQLTAWLWDGPGLSLSTMD